MLETTASTTFVEVQSELKELKGPALLQNTGKKVTVKELKFVDKLNIHLQCQIDIIMQQKDFAQHHCKYYRMPIMWC